MATVVAAVVAIITLLLVLASFRQTTEAQKDAASTTMLQEYLKLRADAIGGDHEEPYLYFLKDGTGTNQYVDGVEPNPEYGWIALHALFTAEQIYLSRGTEDATWEDTAGAIVDDNRQFITEQTWQGEPPNDWFRCDYYGDEFVIFMEDTLQGRGEEAYDVCPQGGLL